MIHRRRHIHAHLSERTTVWKDDPMDPSVNDLFHNVSWKPEPSRTKPSWADTVSRLTLRNVDIALILGLGALFLLIATLACQQILTYQKVTTPLDLLVLLGLGLLAYTIPARHIMNHHLARGWNTTMDCDLPDAAQRAAARPVLKHATPDSRLDFVRLDFVDGDTAWKRIEFGTGFTPTRKPGPWTRAMKDHDGWISIRITHVTPVPPPSSHLFRVDFLATWHATIDGCEQVAEDPREHTWIINSARPFDARIDAP